MDDSGRASGTSSDRPPAQPPPGQRQRAATLSGVQFAGIGLQFAATIVLSALAGVWIDRRVGTSPAFTIVLTFAGAGGGIWSMYRQITAAQRASGGGRRDNT